ncbi:MAG: FAD-dependent oxidoreductase [Ectothiorhodospiraceae bacterium]|nr:FAD-dependent oxidoreductase [Chromatiales bacterium]MCP5155532.1 FAD-dependent oxidoreductase [Ectothiorhodospiraceae bacterium]
MSAPMELAVVGAGPAGMGAAAQAAELGVDVTLLDEQPAPGGQIYRGVDRVLGERPETARVLGEDYRRGASLTAALRRSGARHLADTAVWDLSVRDPDSGALLPAGEGLTLGLLRAGRAEVRRARVVVVASGAMERPVPVPGWTMPGVMSAGGVQTLLKASGLVPGVPTAVVGSGPLVYLVAWQLARAGVSLAAVWVTVPWARRLEAAPAMLAAVGEYGQIAKGLRWRRELRAMGVPLREGVRDVRVVGSERAEGVVGQVGNTEQRVAAGLVVVHEGVIPSIALPRAAGCALHHDALRAAWAPRTDRFGATSVDGVLVAGDAGGVAGALAAEAAGRLAGLEAARRLGRIDAGTRDRLALAPRRALERALRVRPFLDRLFRPRAEVLAPVDEAVVACRCEGVTVATLRRLARAGCAGPNQAKAFSRCGMGPCQGRMCESTVAGVLAAGLRRDVESVGGYRVRAPVKPLTVGELAGLAGLDTPPEIVGGVPIGARRRA